jgi:hypothetical protein
VPAPTGLVIGGDVVCNTVPHLAGTAAVFLAGAGAGLALMIITVIHRSRKRAVNSSTP